jgi:hypothetical protein
VRRRTALFGAARRAVRRRFARAARRLFARWLRPQPKVRRLPEVQLGRIESRLEAARLRYFLAPAVAERSPTNEMSR